MAHNSGRAKHAGRHSAGQLVPKMVDLRVREMAEHDAD